MSAWVGSTRVVHLDPVAVPGEEQRPPLLHATKRLGFDLVGNQGEVHLHDHPRTGASVKPAAVATTTASHHESDVRPSPPQHVCRLHDRVLGGDPAIWCGRRLRALEDEDARFAFRIPGTNNIELCDALDTSAVTRVLMTNELCLGRQLLCLGCQVLWATSPGQSDNGEPFGTRRRRSR